MHWLGRISPRGTASRPVEKFGLAALLCVAALPVAATAQQGSQAPQTRIAEERRSVIVEAVRRVSPSVASVVVSGGPLANASGEIVGINTFILTDSGGSQGLGFAIPIERALKAAAELRTYGRVREADFTGLTLYSSMNAETAEGWGLEGPRGLMVADPGITAEAGLRHDDLILEIDGDPVRTLQEARSALLPRFVGDRVVLGVWRDGRRIEIPFTLTEASSRR